MTDDRLYPKLSEQGKKEAQEVINRLKAEMAKVCEKVISDFYINISCYIESDSWENGEMACVPWAMVTKEDGSIYKYNLKWRRLF